MSHTPQQPADGWQQPQPPVYRPNEQPPAEEPPPWSPESQRVSGMSQQVPPPVEDDGTVKYVGGPGMQQSPQYGPPPGVPVSPFDAPMHQPMPPQQQQYPQGMPASDPFAGGGGMPVSGMPVSGMPPVSSIPASGMPVSGPAGPGQYGQPPFGGQFGPQGGQLVPVSGGGAQPWGAPDAIKRKKKGGKGPMWLLLVGVVVIVAALGVGGFILFSPDEGDPGGETTGTIESVEPEAPPAETVHANEASGLSVLSSEDWVENTEAPAVFTDATGISVADGAGLAYFGTLDATALGATEESTVADIGTAFDALLATHLGGEVGADLTATPYRVDARSAEFRTYTVGETTVLTAVIETANGYVGFAGFAGADQVAAVEAMRSTLTFGS
ncbi:hypothetical protein [Glycomyces harbinensis]|uniref:Uncharacterized protein n=1 Tax=Glycomyces harbinensis TaxID=58114 RepID=A0A1G6U0L6_9ACTN|nr:hypothetical protein [Glycomyces harbinensis]SDD34085.1 hypothetical protein SAMN05216270_103223 [Glycomyces harbinensis]